MTYYRPLYLRAVLALGCYPTHVTADAAFDAWYVYESAARHGGIAAVPLNQHAHPLYELDADGTPRCPKGRPMVATYQFDHTYGYRAQRFRCPLLFPQPTAESCDHEQFAKGRGGVKDVNWELGGQMCVTLERTSPLYHVIFLGRLGYAALGVVFTIVGIFLMVAAIQFNPHQARGLDTALKELLHLPFGPFLLGIVALGLFAYGLYSFVEARYRRLGGRTMGRVTQRQ